MRSLTASLIRLTVVALTTVAVLLGSIAPIPGLSDVAHANEKTPNDLRPAEPPLRTNGDEGLRTTPTFTVDLGPDPDEGDGAIWTEHVVLHEAAATGAPNGVAAGPPSCATNCIERAWLSSALSTTDLTLDVETIVDAAISYHVGDHPPFLGTDGLPYFPTDVTTGATFVDVDDWTTVVGGLTADTDYHIIVTATDGAGTHAVTGTFRTITPANAGIGTFENHTDAGCAFSCIESVLLIPGSGELDDTVDIEVTTDRPADVFVYFGSELEVWVDGQPTFDEILGFASGSTTNGVYVDTATGLTEGETYRAAVFAVDATGGTDIQVQWVTLDPVPSFDLQYVPLRTRVTENGDDVGRGELRFAWRIGDPHDPIDTDSRSRQKIEDGESFWFADHNIYTLLNVAETDVLPDFVITGFEYDYDAFGEFDTGGGPYINPHAGYLDDLDEAYNTAQLHQWAWHGLLEAPTVGDLDDLPSCGSFIEIPTDHDWADATCIKISTHPAGGPGGEEYPEFWTILAITASPAGSGTSALPG